jgi:uncharacterized membrane protein required for colicin V production
MILWVLAILIVGVVALVGYYQGGVRAAFSLVGLLVAVMVAQPLGNVLKPLIAMTGLKQPIFLSFLGPALAFILVLAIFKIIAYVIHQKLETFYKYNNSETMRLLFERLNSRLGIAVGVANGTIYFFVIALCTHLLGYFATQVKGSPSDSIATKIAAKLGEDAQATGMDKAVTPFLPVEEPYYDAVDIVGAVYHNPLLQKRLSSYPVFVTLAERPEFKGMADDLKFQELWLRQPRPSVAELLAHEKVKPLLESEALMKDVMTLVGGDLKDLKTYVETGKSPKYDDEKILGRWSFDYRDSLALARRTKPNIGSAELRQLRRVLGGTMANATLTATIPPENRIILQTPSNQAVPRSEGSWKALTGGRYTITLNEGGKTFETQARVDGNKLIVTRDNYGMVFEK